MQTTENTRARLLAGAVDLFAARGYEAVSVQELAEAGGVQKPTLYHFFGSKRGLLDAVLEHNFAALFAANGPALVYQRDLFPPLHAAALAQFDFAAVRPAFYRLQLAAWFAQPESEIYQAVMPYHQQQQVHLEAFFQRAAQDHGNMRGRHHAFALTYLGMLNTYISIGLNRGERLDSGLAQAAVRQFMHG
ncbi:MAG: TetR/AcrR family transcriptional regulator, partial [Chloroflexota bacterium]